MTVNGVEYEKIMVVENNGALVEVDNETLKQYGISGIILKKKEGRAGASNAGKYECPLCIHNFKDRFPDHFNLALWCMNCKAGSNFSARPLHEDEKNAYRRVVS